MTISYGEQYNLAEKDEDFKHRMVAACFNGARQMFVATPSTDDAVQARRQTLVNLMLKDPVSYTQMFGWAVVSDVNATQETITDDTFLEDIVVTLFDAVAKLTIPTTGGIV